MLDTVAQGRTPDDADVAMAGACRSCALPPPPPPPGPVLGVHQDAAGGDDSEFTAAVCAALECWSAMHGFVLLEMTAVIAGIDTGGLFTDMVMRLTAGMRRR